jgi:hypothetical protein
VDARTQMLLRLLTRGAAALAVPVVAAGLPTGATAHADAHVRDSRNGHHVYLADVGQVDDPMEDVLEHVLLIGGRHTAR